MKTRYLYVFILLFGLSCESENEIYNDYHTEVKVNELIRFLNVYPAQIPADSASSIVIDIQITPETDTLHRKVLLVTNNGLFENESDSIWCIPSYNGQCKAILYSSKNTGIVTVKAKVSVVQIDTVVNFSASYPEDFLLNATSYVVDSGSVFFIKANFFKQFGSVSDNLKVDVSIQKNDSIENYPIFEEFGVIRDDTMSIRVENPFNASGFYTFSVKAPLSEIDSIEKTIQVKFN